MRNIANTEQFEAWNGDSGQRWVADPDRRDLVFTEVAGALFAAASLVAGERVLDIGCGCGATTLAAARAVAAEGAVLGVDLSAPMLEVARRRATAAGVGNVAFEQADLQVHPFDEVSFDVAISRFGTMFFADPVAAFANIAGALGDGGRLCIATWQPPRANDWLTVPGAVLLTYGSTPDIDGPAMFSQAHEAVLTDALKRAGFDGIDVAPVTVSLKLGESPAAATEHLAETVPGHAMLDTIPEELRLTALDALRTVLADHTGPQGVQLDAGILVTTAHLSQ